MIEESEHYMDRLKLHESHVISLDTDTDTRDKHTTRPGPPRAIIATYFTEVEHIARFLLALGP
jgi:hypothetical protein